MAEPIIIDGKWGYKCPVCKHEYITEYTPDEVVHCTLDCLCGALLKVEDDLTCIDFYKRLVDDYKEYGIDNPICGYVDFWDEPC